MIDAYAVGIRLTLNDEVSAGLKTVRRELVALDRAMGVSGAGLRVLGHLGADVGRQGRADVGARELSRAQAVRPTAPAALRPTATTIAKPATDDSTRTRLFSPAGADSAPTAMMSLARRLFGRQPAGAPPAPPTTRVSLTATAASTVARRVITNRDILPAGAKPRHPPLADQPPTTRRASVASASPNAASGFGQTGNLPPPTLGLPRAGLVAASRQPGLERAASGQRHKAPRTGAPPAWASVTLTAEDLSTLAGHLLARKAPLASGLASRPPTPGLAALPPPTPPSAATSRPAAIRPDHAPSIPHAQDRRPHPQTCATPQPPEARPAAAPLWPGLQPGRTAPVPTGALSRQPRAPNVTRPSAPASLRLHHPPPLSLRQHDGAAATRPDSGEIVLDGARFGRLVADRLARLLDRPHSGFTGADPKATPTWPGVSIG